MSAAGSLALLINGAATMAGPLTRDVRGCLSSRGHGFANVDLDDPQFERKPYDPLQAYNQARSANVLFVRSLDRRGTPHQIRAFAVHPGTILDTDLTRHFEGNELAGIGIKIDADGKKDVSVFEANGGIVKSVEQGAATTLGAALSPMLDGLGGLYCEDCDVARVVAADDPSADGVRPWAIDDVAAEETLGALSARLTAIDTPVT